MAVLRINPAKLPYRGEPTRDTRPDPKIPPHLKVTVLEGPWNRETKAEATRARKERAKTNSKKSNPHAWSEEADEELLRMYRAGVEYEDISRALGRTEKAIQLRLSGMRARGVKDIDPRPPKRQTATWYTAEEDKTIIRMHNEGAPIKEIAKTLNRTTHGINTRLVILRKMGHYLPDTRGKQGNRRKNKENGNV